MAYSRPHSRLLARRLAESRRFVQVVAGPRQVGKTTLVRQVAAASGLLTRYASADEPTLRGPDWIASRSSRRLNSAPASPPPSPPPAVSTGSSPLPTSFRLHPSSFILPWLIL